MKANKVETVRKMHKHMPVKCDECFEEIPTGRLILYIVHKKKKRNLAQVCSHDCLKAYMEREFE